MINPEDKLKKNIEPKLKRKSKKKPKVKRTRAQMDRINELDRGRRLAAKEAGIKAPKRIRTKEHKKKVLEKAKSQRAEAMKVKEAAIIATEKLKISKAKKALVSKRRGESNKELQDRLKYTAKMLLSKEVELLRQMSEHKNDNKIYFLEGFNPPQQRLFEAWQNPEKSVFTATGGNRFGKTFLGVHLVIATCIGFYPWFMNQSPDFILANGGKLDSGTKNHPFNWILNPERKQPRKIRWIGQDWESHIKQVILPALEEFWPKKRPVRKIRNQQGIQTKWIDEKSGSTIDIMSNNQEVKVFEGWDGDLIVYDEPPKRDVRIANARGLVDREGRELFCMTLLNERWVYKDIIKAKLRNGQKDYSIFNVTGETTDNVGFGITQRGVEKFAAKLTKEEYEARIKGVPAFMSTLVYPQYDPDIHLVKRFKVPLDWPICVAIDIHLREPQAILFIATAPDGRKYLVNEVFQNGDGTWIGEQVARCVMDNGYRVDHVIVDPFAKSDYNNGDTVFDKIQAVIRHYDMYLETGSKDKVSGILAVRQHLLSENNMPSLFIFDDLQHTIGEFEGYCYDKNTRKPVDADDHMMENLYRLLLLDSKWELMQRQMGRNSYERNSRKANSRSSRYQASRTRNKTTGY